MDLARELRSANVEFSIDQVFEEVPSTRTPGLMHQVPRMRVRFADFASVEKGQTPPTLVYLMTPDSNLTVRKVLAIGLMRLMPNHPVRHRYLDAAGNTPVTIAPTSLDQGNIAEAIHTQLRKCIDSKQSVIQWNAIHYLMPDDWGQITKMIKVAIEGEIARCEKKAMPILRRNVGLAIKKAMTEGMDEVTYRDSSRGDDGVRVKGFKDRTGEQQFALRAFEAANHLTDDEDWTFGWTSFVCKDAEPEEAPKVAKGAEVLAAETAVEVSKKPVKKAASRVKP